MKKGEHFRQIRIDCISFLPIRQHISRDLPVNFTIRRETRRFGARSVNARRRGEARRQKPRRLGACWRRGRRKARRAGMDVRDGRVLKGRRSGAKKETEDRWETARAAMEARRLRVMGRGEGIRGNIDGKPLARRQTLYAPRSGFTQNSGAEKRVHAGHGCRQRSCAE